MSVTWAIKEPYVDCYQPKLTLEIDEKSTANTSVHSSAKAMEERTVFCRTQGNHNKQKKTVAPRKGETLEFYLEFLNLRSSVIDRFRFIFPNSKAS